MKRDPVTIELADQSFEIRPLTCRQIAQIEPILAKSGGGSVMAIEIIKVGLSRDHAGADIDDLEVSVDQLLAGMLAICGQCGVVPKGQATPGEVPAAAAHA